jgi:CubicO group peptidase (beta-lactamase class C family)
MSHGVSESVCSFVMLVNSSSSTLHTLFAMLGLCSTGNDFPKFAQLLINEGMDPDGVRVLSKYGVSQMFSHGGGNAVGSGDALFGIPGSPAETFMFTRCYPRMQEYDGVPVPLPTNPFIGKLPSASLCVAFVWNTLLTLLVLIDYGLGTMVLAGNYGEVFGHLGSTGGGWFVAPGRYAYHLAWMNGPFANPSTGILPYLYIGDVSDDTIAATFLSVWNLFSYHLIYIYLSH